jgi:hypothetical protein
MEKGTQKQYLSVKTTDVALTDEEEERQTMVMMKKRDRK